MLKPVSRVSYRIQLLQNPVISLGPITTADAGVDEWTAPAALTSRSRPSTARQQWVDVAKGLGILLVILTHTVHGLEPSGILPSGTPWPFWYDFFYTFHVPIFFFITGLFCESSYDKYGFRKFITSRLAALAYPYVLWQTVQILLMYAAGGATNEKPHLTLLIAFPLFPYMQYWFLYALMLVLSLYSILRRAGASRHLIFAISLGMLFLPPVGWQQYSHDKTPLAWQSYNDLCCHMFYFGAGLMLPAAMPRLFAVRWWLVLPATAGCFFGVFAAVYFGIDQGSMFRPLPAVLGIFGMSLAAMLIVHVKLDRLLAYLGRHSLELYVAHVAFAAGMRIALIRMFHIHNLAVHVAFGMLAGIVGPLCLLWLERVTPRHFSLYRLPSAARP